MVAHTGVWSRLTPFFDYPLEIREGIYKTNAFESLNMGQRKLSKLFSRICHCSRGSGHRHIFDDNVLVRHWWFSLCKCVQTQNTQEAS